MVEYFSSEIRCSWCSNQALQLGKVRTMETSCCTSRLSRISLEEVLGYELSIVEVGRFVKVGKINYLSLVVAGIRREMVLKWNDKSCWMDNVEKD